MTAITERAERLLLRLYYLLWQRHRHRRLTLEHIAGYDLLVLPEVMNPRIFRSGEYFAHVLLTNGLVPANSHVLDMGTGSGITALIAARRAARIVAVDINPAAVRCAQLNVLLNGVENRVDVRRGDLFGPLAGDTFDLALFNPPYFRGTPAPGFDQAWRSENTVERFAKDLHIHLRPQGSALLVLSNHSDSDAFIHAFNLHGYHCEKVAWRRLLAETLTVYRFCKVEKE